jgi:hypothetical protein
MAAVGVEYVAPPSSVAAKENMAFALRNSTTALTAFSSLCLSLLGCASASPPPSSVASAAATQSTKPATALEPAAEPAKPAQAEAAAEPAKSDAAKPADEPGDGLRKASRPPMDLLTGNNVVYVLNFSGSAAGASAKERCEGQGDPPAVRECVAKERAKIAVESVRFVKDAHGQYWWVTYNRYKGNLLKWHKVQFMPGKQDADTISLTLIGKDKGIAPMPRVPAALKVELPNDYSIVVSDPEYGAMVYDAKIGLLDAD